VKARTLTVRPTLAVVIGAEVVGIVAFAALPVARFGWWPAAAITAVTLIVLSVAVHRRNVVAWLVARVRWLRRRRYTTPVGAAIDVSHGDVVYGVRTAGDEAVTVIRVDGRPYAPTFLRGSTVSRTVNVLPLEILTRFLEQPGGLRVAIDVVSSGYRVRPESGYPQLYTTLLADRGAAGQRTTHLVVRMQIRASLAGLSYRRSIGTTAAAATERIIKALQQDGVRAVALTAAEHDELLDTLSLGLATAPARPAVTDPDDRDEDDPAADPDPAGEGEPADGPAGAGGRAARRAARRAAKPEKVRAGADVGWRTINVRPGYVTSYYFSPEDISTATFNQMWALRTDRVVHVLMLSKHHGAVRVSALVRTNDPRPPEQPPTLDLNPLPGSQYEAVLAAAPTSRPDLRLPSRLLTPGELELPIGPTGILVGSAMRDDPAAEPEVQRDDLVMWALSDPQRPTRIKMDTSDFFVRQLLIRAAAAGERIAIYSADPRRWVSVSQSSIAVVEPRRPAEFVPTIIVSDHPRVAPPAGLAPTVITVGHAPDGSAPDIRFQQNSPTAVRIFTGPKALDIAVVVFRQEQTWTGV